MFMNDFVKKPGASSSYTAEQIYDIDQCEEDPFYFIEKFMKVQHPTKGSLPLDLYEFQKRIVQAFHTHEKVIALTARQMGKCVTADTLVSQDGKQVQIGDLVEIGLKDRVVHWLETKLIYLSTKSD